MNLETSYFVTIDDRTYDRRPTLRVRHSQEPLKSQKKESTQGYLGGWRNLIREYWVWGPCSICDWHENGLARRLPSVQSLLEWNSTSRIEPFSIPSSWWLITLDKYKNLRLNEDPSNNRVRNLRLRDNVFASLVPSHPQFLRCWPRGKKERTASTFDDSHHSIDLPGIAGILVSTAWAGTRYCAQRRIQRW